MLRSEPTAGADPELDTVTVIADALRTKFGDLSLSVALTQRHNAPDDARATWDAIVEHLKD
jgi:hypothetical protein